MIDRLFNRWTFVALLALAAACNDDETIDVDTTTCPNAFPTAGDSCPQANLVCNYFTGCLEYVPATCGADLRWSVTDTCVLPDGAGGEGGEGGDNLGGAPAGGTGGVAAGGDGGSGGLGGSGGSTGGSGGNGGSGGA